MLFSAHCHCAWCRRAHGAAFVTWLGVKEERFTLRDEDRALRWYASSEQSRRGFCSRCGTTLFFQSTLAPREMHVALACTENATDFPPTVHVFWDAHVAWVEMGDALPRADRDAPGLAKYRVVPRAP